MSAATGNAFTAALAKDNEKRRLPRLQHFPRVFARGCSDFLPAQHAGDFFHTFIFAQFANACASGFVAGQLADLKVLVRLRGNLWQVGHAHDLVVFPQCLKLFADCFGDGTTDAAIDFIENQGRYVGVCGFSDLDGETDAGQFTT